MEAKGEELKARGEELAMKMAQNRVEQEEIRIKMEAAKKILALYDSVSDDANSRALSSAAEAGQGGGGGPRERGREKERPAERDAERRAERSEERLHAERTPRRGSVPARPEPPSSVPREQRADSRRASLPASVGESFDVPTRVPSDGAGVGGASDRVPAPPASSLPSPTAASARGPGQAATPSPPSLAGAAKDAGRRMESTELDEDLTVSIAGRERAKALPAGAPGSFDMRKRVMYRTMR